MEEIQAQKLYEKMVNLQEQARTLDQHLSSMQEQIRSIESSIKTITELENMSEAKETWIPIAPGAYVKTRTEPVKEVLLNVGAGIAVEKKPSQVMETLNDHKKVLEELTDQAILELKEALSEMEKIRNQVESAEQEKNVSQSPTTKQTHTKITNDSKNKKG